MPDRAVGGKAGGREGGVVVLGAPGFSAAQKSEEAAAAAIECRLFLGSRTASFTVLRKKAETFRPSFFKKQTVAKIFQT